jgi:hypothetical protein
MPANLTPEYKTAEAACPRHVGRAHPVAGGDVIEPHA